MWTRNNDAPFFYHSETNHPCFTRPYRGLCSRFFSVQVDRKNISPDVDNTDYDKSASVDVIDGTTAKPRGPYSGAMGYFGLGNGATHFNVIIRTAVVTPTKGGSSESMRKVSIGCGGAIVKDSEPMEEYEEMRAKGSVVCNAVARAIRKQ